MDNNSGGIGAAVILIIVAVYVVIIAVAIWANVRIIRRSGYSGWWVLIGLVPIVGLVMYLVFAFKEAPTERELKQLRAWAAGQQGGGYGNGGYGDGGYGNPYPPNPYPPTPNPPQTNW